MTRRLLAKSQAAHVRGTAGVEGVYNQRPTRGEFHNVVFISMEEKLIHFEACPIARGPADV
jgi:hypothetical protein